MAGVKIGKGLGTLERATLRFYRQIGVEQVLLPANCREQSGFRPLVPPAQTGPQAPHMVPWDRDVLNSAITQIESVGLEAIGIHLTPSGSILMGHPGRDRDIEVYMSNLALAGQLGLTTLTYNFTALRASEGYASRREAGRGGASLRDFDARRIDGLAPLPNVGQHTREAMWERLAYFVRAIIPFAEEAGVRLALHPNDPPVPVYRGVAQPVCCLQDMMDVLDIIDSPSNGLFLDTGVLTELGEDVPQTIRTIGGRERIVAVHMRNVHVERGSAQYLETFHDQGDCDLAACMRALYDVGYTGLIDPDHTPHLAGDCEEARAGWALAIGQIIGLRAAVESERSTQR